MTDVNEGMVLRGRGLDKWYGAKHDRRQVLFGGDADVRAGECLRARSSRWFRDGASADP